MQPGVRLFDHAQKVLCLLKAPICPLFNSEKSYNVVCGLQIHEKRKYFTRTIPHVLNIILVFVFMSFSFMLVMSLGLIFALIATAPMAFPLTFKTRIA